MPFLRGLRRPPRCDVLFLCSATIDEVWIRSTIAACRRLGLAVRLSVCDDGGAPRHRLAARYDYMDVVAEFGVTFAQAARTRCRVAVTASSGLDRTIFPSRAGWFVHMPHSLASLHMVYPADAFDGYDVLLAAGPHHLREHRAIAKARGLSGRVAKPVGYGKMDLLAATGSEPAGPARNGREVLVAPSWGPDNLLDRCGLELVERLVADGYRVTVRPHPLFMLEDAPVVRRIAALSGAEPRIRLESPLDGDGAIFSADVMVGDYSGTSFEFAALRLRPVVSVDVGLKVANPGWEAFGLPPVEVADRRLIGPVVEPDVANICEAIEACASETVADSNIERFLFRPPEGCGERAAMILKEMVEGRYEH
jgi:hypothetical protein